MRRTFPLLAFLAVGCSSAPPDGVDDADAETARMKAMGVQHAANSYTAKTGERLRDIDDLAPLLDKGETALLDPWGQKYQFEYAEVEPNRYRLVVFTTEPKSGKRFGWPRELAEK